MSVSSSVILAVAYLELVFEESGSQIVPLVNKCTCKIFECDHVISFVDITFNAVPTVLDRIHIGTPAGLENTLIRSLCSDFILPILQPNTGCFPIQKRPVFSQFWRFFSQPKDFIGIYSIILKAQAVSLKRQ